MHEDEDDEEDDDDNDNDDHDTHDLAAPTHGDDDDTTVAKAAPLQPVSLNTSPRKRPSVDKPVSRYVEDLRTSKPTDVEDSDEMKANTKQAVSPPSEDTSPPQPAAPPSRGQAELTADLASLVERQQRRTADSEHHTPAQRLKHRKLGRAASGSSLANRTNSGSNTINQDIRHGDTSFSESPESMSAPQQENLPGTQIGYETLEAEDARLQMAKRMGTSYSDESSGTRLASLGTVRDSAGPAAAPGGRARNRARK